MADNELSSFTDGIIKINQFCDSNVFNYRKYDIDFNSKIKKYEYVRFWKTKQWLDNNGIGWCLTDFINKISEHITNIEKIRSEYYHLSKTWWYYYNYQT